VSLKEDSDSREPCPWNKGPDFSQSEFYIILGCRNKGTRIVMSYIGHSSTLIRKTSEVSATLHTHNGCHISHFRC